MEDIWQQFHRLPKAIRDSVATPAAIAAVDDLENQYPQLDLANFIMRVMVKSVPAVAMETVIAKEGNIDAQAAAAVVDKLRATVFSAAADYLGLAKSAPKAPVAPTPEPAVIPPTPIMPPPPPSPTPQPAPPQPVAPVPSVTLRPLGASPTPITGPRPPVPSAPAAEPAVAIVSAPEPSVPTGPLAPTQAYSDEEAKEIELQAKKLQQLSGDNSSLDFEDIAQAVLAKQQLAFRDELLTKRAVAIIKARLKNIRSADDTKEVMTRSPKIGGLGLDPDLAGNVVASLEQRVSTVKSRGMVAPPVPIPPPLPPPVPKVEQQRPEPKPPVRMTLPPANLPVQAQPLPNFTEATKPSRPIVRPADIPLPPPLPTSPPPVPAAHAPTIQQRPRVLDRTKVADIAKPNRTFGPTEEMRSMSLAEFRRLGQGANDATRRLLEKFKQLQDESFRLWAEAVAGWRQSDIYRLYLDMGRQSLEENMSITDVIQRRAKQGQPYLSEHEFTALADLNRQLRL